MSLVKIEKKDRVAVITIDRSEALNALNHQVLLELRSKLLQLDDVAVIILTGAGKSFVAGADISEINKMTPMGARAFVELGQGVMQLIEEAPFISIAAVNGFALGGGLELALACDLIYASDKAKLGLPETNLGIIPGFGGTQNILKRVGFHRGMELVLTGKTLSSEEAKAVGLVLEVFKSDELMPQVLQIADRLSKKGLMSMLAARRVMRSHVSESREKNYLLERESFATLFTSGEPQEGTKAFLEKREPKFAWPSN